MKFRKRAVEIEAIQWNGENLTEISDFLKSENFYHNKGKSLIIVTLEGDMEARLNDWVIKGVNNEFYPCKPDIFEKTYEKVE